MSCLDPDCPSCRGHLDEKAMAVVAFTWDVGGRTLAEGINDGGALGEAITQKLDELVAHVKEETGIELTIAAPGRPTLEVIKHSVPMHVAVEKAKKAREARLN